MRLDTQQKMTSFIFVILIVCAFGAMAFIISGKSDDRGEITPPILSISTATSELSASGWWDSIPTDPSLPTMPARMSALTPTAAQTPTSSP